ncbi:MULTISPECIES: glycine zipper 2TM domain-containing protein [Halomonadaceae]|uniref:glycine zipper 2TM domain-containing protein n=1 Tax=Halomonadaceae TaxID=28256 RepID=UPI00159AF062|nr:MULTISPECIES: glycine zipper 2TM domain-containing protein [Halomonas]QJQ96458.1 glycine zipper 2TM domain-containing protein [Halomonas sp. PA5]
MNKSIVIGATLAVFGLGGLAVGAYQVQNYAAAPQYADILRVDTVSRTVETPREVCENVVVSQRAPVQDHHRIAGTAAGAVVGGLLGNQIGGGSGKKLATVAGAVGGGFAGREVQGRMQNGNVTTTTQRQCHTVVDSQEEFQGYDVEYRYEDRVYSVRLDEAPQGSRVLMDNGRPQWGRLDG